MEKFERKNSIANSRLIEWFKPNIPEFQGCLRPEEFWDWVTNVEEIFDNFYQAPEQYIPRSYTNIGKEE
jgi:hypothetical protein